MLTAYANFLYRFRWPLALFFTALFVFCLFVAKHLKLKSDFKELLPEKFQSVRDLDRIAKRVGGESTLIITIQSNDPQNSIRFALDLINRLKQLPPEYIQRIEYNVSDAKKF